MKKCPNCDEEIQINAPRCRSCGVLFHYDTETASAGISNKQVRVKGKWGWGWFLLLGFLGTALMRWRKNYDSYSETAQSMADGVSVLGPFVLMLFYFWLRNKLKRRPSSIADEANGLIAGLATYVLCIALAWLATYFISFYEHAR